MSKWANCSYDDALRMRHENPVRFKRLLGWANVEAEAEPLAYKHQAAKARRNAEHEENAQPQY